MLDNMSVYVQRGNGGLTYIAHGPFTELVDFALGFCSSVRPGYSGINGIRDGIESGNEITPLPRFGFRLNGTITFWVKDAFIDVESTGIELGEYLRRAGDSLGRTGDSSGLDVSYSWGNQRA